MPLSSRKLARAIVASSWVIFVWGILASFSAQASAQWTDYQLQLEAGWNGIFLEVDPWPADADTLFNGLPIETVWMRADAPAVAGSTTCLNPDDPNCVPPDDSGWRTWVPLNHPARSTQNLGVIRGGQAYLMRASEAFVWNVSGRPAARKTPWQIGFNHVGFYVDEAGTTPTFASYLAPFTTLGAQSLFAIGADAALVPIGDASSARTRTGTSYWVKSTKAGTYDGPVEIDLGSLRGVEFSKNIVEHALTLVNLAGATRALRIAYAGSASAPTEPPGSPGVAGDVPMRFWDYDSAQQVFLWRVLTSQTFVLTTRGQVGSRRLLRLAVHREGLGPAELDGEGHGSQYQGVLTVTDGQGFRRRLPVSAQVPAGLDGTVAGGAGGAGGGRAGLYVGTATLNAVSWVTSGARSWVNSDPVNPQLQPGATDDRTTPRATPAEFVFPIIVHLDDAGVYRMLHEVRMMWRPGDEEAGIAGEFVLVTPECPPQVLAMLEAGGIQDGEPYSRRLGTAAFYFTDPLDRAIDLVLTGGFEGMLQGTTLTRGNDRLNPFRHRFHPDHDCNEAGECFDITRTFALTFDLEPTPGEFRPGHNEAYLRGTYSETITGLHRDPIRVGGTFQLSRVSRVGRLNGQ